MNVAKGDKNEQKDREKNLDEGNMEKILDEECVCG